MALLNEPDEPEEKTVEQQIADLQAAELIANQKDGLP